MKKTLNIHIGGMPFVIEEEAYLKLHQYIEKLKSRFRNENERNEIITDIESRIAEVFTKRLDKNRIVISEEDVQFIMEQLGKPEDIVGEESDQEHSAQREQTTNERGSYTSYKQYSPHGTKKLFRDGENKIAGGVIAGLCQYFGIQEPIWMRILFVLLLLAGIGSPLLVYIVFWLIIPEAKTTGDKLQMKGEPVTLENIEREVRDTVNRATDAFNRPVKDSNLLGKMGTVLLLLVKGMLKLLAAIVFLGCLIAMLIFLATMFGVSFLGMKDLAPVTELVLDNRSSFFIGFIGLVLTIGIPIFIIMYACGRFLVSSRVPISKSYVFPILILWAIGIVMFAFVEHKVERNFNITESRNEQAELLQPQNDTLLITSFRDTSNLQLEINHDNNDEDAVGIIMNKDFLKTENGYIVGESELELAVSQDGRFHLEKEVSATGRTKADANKSIDLINTRHKQDGAALSLNAWVEIYKKAKFRKQEQINRVYIPEGKFVLMDANNQLDLEVNDDADYSSSEAKGKLFTVKNGKVVCLNCLDRNIKENNDEEEEENESSMPASIVINGDSISIDGKDNKSDIHIHVGKKGVNIQTRDNDKSH